MGASLLAMAFFHSINVLNVTPLSPAGWLPQGSALLVGLGINIIPNQSPHSWHFPRIVRVLSGEPAPSEPNVSQCRRASTFHL
ncbi:hypothetical protein EMIT0P100_20109 [Pseudomonas sp. IT-P100]